MLFEMERAHTLEDMEGLLDKLKRVLDREPELRGLFVLWFEYVMERRESFTLSDEQLHEWADGYEGGVAMLREKMARWGEEIADEAREQGREEGRFAERRSALLNLLELRFGKREGREEELHTMTLERMREATERVMDREGFPDEQAVLMFEE